MDGQKKGGEGETRRGNRPTVVSRRSPSVRVGWYLDNAILTYVPVVLHMARKKGGEGRKLSLVLQVGWETGGREKPLGFSQFGFLLIRLCHLLPSKRV